MPRKNNKLDVKKFIAQYANTGDAKQSAIDAGAKCAEYGYTLVKVHRLAIDRAVQELIVLAAPKALKTLKNLLACDNANVSRAAAKDILSMGGHDVQRVQDVDADTRTDQELIKEIMDDDLLMQAITDAQATKTTDAKLRAVK